MGGSRNAARIHLLSKKHQLVEVGEKEEGRGVVDEQTVIRCFFTASNLVPVCAQINLPSCILQELATNRIVPIKLSTKYLYSSAGASLRAFQTFE